MTAFAYQMQQTKLRKLQRAKPLHRPLWIVGLASGWLLAEYPYGLLLFLIGCCWHATLQRAQQPIAQVLDKIGSAEVLADSRR